MNISYQASFGGFGGRYFDFVLRSLTQSIDQSINKSLIINRTNCLEKLSYPKNHCYWMCASVLVTTWVWLKKRKKKEKRRQGKKRGKISVIGYVLLCWWRHGSDYAFADWTNHIFYNVSASAFFIFSVNFRSCEVAGRHKISLESAKKPNKVHFNTWRFYSTWEKCSNILLPLSTV